MNNRSIVPHKILCITEVCSNNYYASDTATDDYDNDDVDAATDGDA